MKDDKIKIPKYIKKLGDRCSKYGKLHRNLRNEFEIFLMSKGIDVYELSQDGGDEVGYVDCIGYGYGYLNWKAFEDFLNNSKKYWLSEEDRKRYS